LHKITGIIKIADANALPIVRQQDNYGFIIKKQMFSSTILNITRRTAISLSLSIWWSLKILRDTFRGNTLP